MSCSVLGSVLQLLLLYLKKQDLLLFGIFVVVTPSDSEYYLTELALNVSINFSYDWQIL